MYGYVCVYICVCTGSGRRVGRMQVCAWFSFLSPLNRYFLVSQGALGSLDGWPLTKQLGDDRPDGTMWERRRLDSTYVVAVGVVVVSRGHLVNRRRGSDCAAALRARYVSSAELPRPALVEALFHGPQQRMGEPVPYVRLTVAQPTNE